MSGVCDVAIVGGGPAGLSAAVELKRGGVARVVVLERFEEAGGIPRHCGHPPFGLREFGRVMAGPAYARRLVAEAERAGVEIRTKCAAMEIRPGGVLELATVNGPEALTAKRILIATGNRERTRAQLLAPGLRPLGVLNTAALQSFVYLEQRRPFARPVIIGSELVSLSALLTCRRHGMRPAALIDTSSQPRTRAINMALCKLLRTPVMLGVELLSIEGRGGVEGLKIRRKGGAEEVLACDGVIFSGRFTPEATLARQSGLTLDPGALAPEVDADWRSSDPFVFVAGNVLHPVETAGYCWREGRKAARAIIEDLARPARAPAAARIRLGEGLRYVTPQRIAPGQGPVTLNIRAEGAARGRLSLRDAGGREIAAARVRSYPEQPLRLKLPALESGALSGDLLLTLEKGG